MAAACGGDGGTTPRDTTPVRVVLAPGGPDTLAPGTTRQLTATVYAADSGVVTGQSITYSSTDSSVVRVNSAGLLAATQTPGLATVTASTGGITSNSVSVVVFDQASVGAPRHISQFQTTPESLAVGTSTPVQMLVTDPYGAPVAGAAVTFTVQHGGGSVTQASATTDANGVAGTTWTMGTSTGGSDILQASISSAQASVTCTPTPGAPVTLAMSVPYAGARVGAPVTLSTTAQDAYGNVFTPANVQFVPRNASVVTLQSAATVGAATFTAQAIGTTYVVGSVAGLADSTLVSVFAANGVLLSASAPSFALKTDTVFSTALQLSVGPSTPPIGSMTVTVTWDPAVLTYVSDAQAVSGPSVVVNRSNVANGSLTIALAASSPVAGSTPLLDLSFAAASTAGRHGTLAVTVSDISDNNFMNLLPVTQVSSFPVRTR